MPLIRLVHLTAVAGLLPCVTACATNRYRVPLASFRDYMQPTIGALRDLDQSRNSHEIDLYSNGVAVDATKEVLTRDSDGPTPLGVATFSLTGVAAHPRQHISPSSRITSTCRLMHLLKQAPIRPLIGPSIGNI